MTFTFESVYRSHHIPNNIMLMIMIIGSVLEERVTELEERHNIDTQLLKNHFLRYDRFIDDITEPTPGTYEYYFRGQQFSFNESYYFYRIEKLGIVDFFEDIRKLYIELFDNDDLFRGKCVNIKVAYDTMRKNMRVLEP